MTGAGKLYLFTVVFIFALSLAAPLLPLLNPDKIDLDSLREPPGLKHPFGTDHKGRDILSRVIYGAKVSISVAIAASCASCLAGSLVGLTAGYFGGRIDAALMAITDFILSFPALLLAIAVSVVLPPGIYTAMIALSTAGWTSFARLIREQVLNVKGLSYVEAARAVGCSDT